MASNEPTVKLSTDRTFGLVFAVFLALVWLVPLVRRGESRWWALGLSALFLLLALAIPKILHPLNLVWAKLAVALHYLISPIAMGLVFFLAFAPMGLLLRAFGKDLLRLRRGPNTGSYWILRDPPGPSPESMTQQF
jgi:hypothetical protein